MRIVFIFILYYIWIQIIIVGDGTREICSDTVYSRPGIFRGRI